jgi:hypothetical protein
MGKSIAVLGLCLLALSCTHSITRIGYTESTAPPAEPCRPVIRKAAEIGSVAAKKLGSIKLGDTGLSTTCEETDALRILEQEACALGADIISITDEKRADLFSTCYRVEADFLKSTDSASSDTIGADPEYNESAVMNRTENDQERKVILTILGVVIGFCVGFFITSSMTR